MYTTRLEKPNALKAIRWFRIRHHPGVGRDGARSATVTVLVNINAVNAMKRPFAL